MDEISGLRLLVAAVAGGSFSEAGRRLGLPPSSVSRQIAQLERHLGVELFARTTRLIALTEAGRVYHAQARKILADLEAANSAVLSLQKKPQGVLTVETRKTIANRLLAPLLPTFFAQFPQIRLNLRVTDETRDSIHDGVDVVLRFGLGRNSALKSRKILDTQRVLLASPDYLAREGTPRTPADLRSHNCLVFSRSTGAAWRFKGPAGIEDIAPIGSLEVNDVDVLCAALVTGVGLSVLHRWMVRDELRSRRLVPVLDDYEVTTGRVFSTPIYAIYHPRLARAAKLQGFLSFIKASLATASAST